MGPLKAAIFVVVLALSLALTTLPRASHAASSGLQYDEVTKFSSGDSNPQPGTFQPDFQAAVAAGQQAAAAQNAPQGHGLFGGLKNMANLVKSEANSLKSGFASREYYLGMWHRTDDPGAQTATINKPDQHQIIYLDLAKKTYRIVDTGGGMPSMSQAQPPGPPSAGSPPPPPQPGTGNLTVTVSNSSLGPRTIEGVPTNGYTFAFKSTMSNATGSCSNGSFETSATEYISSYADPAEAVKVSMPTHRPTYHAPDTAALPVGCKPKVTRHISSGGQSPTGRLAMFSVFDLGANAPVQGTQMGGKVRAVTERGNVRTLGAGDKNLFEIPAGFTKEVPSPAPNP